MARPTYFRPYELRPGWPITFEVRCADGSAAIVTGVVEKVPHLAGNIAQRVIVRDATARPLTPGTP